MKIKNLFQAFVLSLAVFSAGNFAFANQVQVDEKISTEPALGSHDITTTILINSLNDKENSSPKTTAAKYGYVDSKVSGERNTIISNTAIDKYLEMMLGPFFITLIIVLSFAIFSYLKGDTKKGKDLTISSATHGIAFFGLIGGVNSFIGGFIISLVISITASGSGLGFGVVKESVSSKYVNDTNQYYKLASGDNEFVSILEIAIAEKRTLQFRSSFLQDKNEFEDLSVKQYAEYFKEIESFGANELFNTNGSIGRIFHGQFTGYDLVAKVKEQPFYSFSKDKYNHPAVVASFRFANDFNEESSEYNGADYSRQNMLEQIMEHNQFNFMNHLSNIQEKVKVDLEAGSNKYLDSSYKDITDQISKSMLASIETVYNENSTDNELVDNAEFMLNIIAAKFKGIDKQKTILKIFNEAKKLSMNALNLQCVMNDERRRMFDMDFQKFITSNKDMNKAVLDSKVNLECIIPQDGKFIQLGYNELTESEEIKNAVNELKSFKEAGTILYKIIDNAKSIALSNFISKNYNSIERINYYQKFGLAGLFPTLEATTSAGYAAFKISSSNRADIVIDNSSMAQGVYFYQDAVFGFEEDDLNAISEKDMEYAFSHYHNLNTAPYFNSKNVVKKFNMDDLKLAQQQSKSDGSEKIIDEMLGKVMLGFDNIFKYSAALPQNLTIREGLLFCETDGNCDSIYKPSLYEVQVNGGKVITENSFYCLLAVNTIKATSRLLDVSNTQGLIGKAKAGVKFAAKALKVAVVGAEIVASTYETPCTLSLISGLTMGYITPIFQTAAGTVSLMVIVFSIIMMIKVGPVIVATSYILSISGHSDILKDYFMRILGYILQIYLFVAIILMVMWLYSLPPYQLIRMLLGAGFSNEATIITMIATLIVVVIVVITLGMKIFSLLQTFLNDIFAALRINNRVDTSADTKIMQAATGTMIAKQLTSTGTLTFGKAAELLSKNKENIATAQENEKNISKMAKDAFSGKSQKELDVILKDPEAKKLYDFYKENEKE